MWLWHLLLHGSCHDQWFGRNPNHSVQWNPWYHSHYGHRNMPQYCNWTNTPITYNSSFTHCSANTDPNAHLHIRARSFRNTGQDAFLIVGYFVPTHPATIPWPLPQLILNIKLQREYAQRVRDIKHGVFTPLVLSATGGMGHEATTFYKRLAYGITLKEDKPYSSVIGWIGCRLWFSILCSAILCIRGTWSSCHHPIHGCNIALATSQGCVPLLENYFLSVYLLY